MSALATGAAGAAAPSGGWAALFTAAFTNSRNAMVLLDVERRQVDANGAWLKLLGVGRQAVLGVPIHHFVEHGPQLTGREWHAALAAGRATGSTHLVGAGGNVIAVQWGASAEL